MTAFNDILSAEKEAVNSIEVAKAEVAKAVEEARSDFKTRIDTETARIDKEEKTALEAHEAHIFTLTQKIKTEVDKQVATIKSNFESQQADVKKKIKKMFV